MSNFGKSEEILYSLLDASVRKNIPEAVLLSGGIDSTAIAYLAKQYDADLKCITIVNRNAFSPDREYARLAAKSIGIKTHIYGFIEEEELESLVERVVLSLGSFNIFWVSAALVLYKGMETARENKIQKIATGEGSDDLFGSFPVMLNWKYGEEELIEFIRIRMDDIDLMTEKVSKDFGCKIILPFHEKRLKTFALDLPMRYRVQASREGEKITKFILRESFRGKLPDNLVDRPQTMAFTGASTLEYLGEKYEHQCQVNAFRKKYKINFRNSFECFLFEILVKHGEYVPASSQDGCLYCHSQLRIPQSVHCVVCGTLQYRKEILPF